jgi:hypothetical protein
MADDPHRGPVDVLAIDESVITASGSAGFGVNETGFVAKPYARLLAEKLATARALLGDDLDLTAGSIIRKLLEVSALEDARTWSALASWYDNSFITSASGSALDRLGEELGLPRPFEQARGRIEVALAASLPTDTAAVTLPRGARLLSAGGHHAALDETVVLSPAAPVRTVAVSAFYPGPEHNLDPAASTPGGRPGQRLDRWHPDDPALDQLFALSAHQGSPVVTITHTKALTEGERRWSDARYRELLLRAPRSLWRADAIEVVVSLIPGVRQVLVRDSWSGLDLSDPVFGGMRFLERLFSTDRDVVSPYFFRVLVAPTRAALWDGPDGLRSVIEDEIEDLRPISIYAQVERVQEVGIGVAATIALQGLPVPTGPSTTMNASPPATALKARLLQRARRHIDTLRVGEPVRWSELLAAFMDEPGVVDVADLRLLRYPAGLDELDLLDPSAAHTPRAHAYGDNIHLPATHVPVLVDDASHLLLV